MTKPPLDVLPLRVLVVDTLADATILQRVFGDHLTLIIANTMDEAVAALDRSIDTIVCNIHFERCRMFDLLRMAKADPLTRAIPFVCFRDLDVDLGMSVTEELDFSTKALGAAAFVDMYVLKCVNGVADADTYLRNLVVDLARRSRALRGVHGA